jgi:type I restriction enzyme S subunit
VSFPRYPKYKPSGVEWLGEVPEHWEVDRLKRSVTSCKNGTWGDDATGGQDDVVCVRVADFDRNRFQVHLSSPTLRAVPMKDRAGRLLAEGDLLLEKSGGGETSPVGFVVRWAHTVPAVCSNFVARLEPAEQMSSSYWCYANAAAYSVGINTRSIKQTSGIQNLDSQQYLDEPFLFPPLAEQRAIAAFLDRETAKIDALIAEQEKLIELLAEKRQAVISHAVTKGLNPAAPMKPSGIEWLGDVPAHWDIAPLRYVADCLDGIRVPLNAEQRSLRLGSIPYWGANSVVDHVDAALVSEPVVLLGEDGAPFFDKPKPVAFFVEEPVWPNNHVHVLRPRGSTKGAYLAAVLNITEYAHFIDGSTRDKLTQSAMNSIPIPMPPVDEQDSIGRHLAAADAGLAGLGSECQLAIDLLRERRAALISAAVTGQIDVRNAVPEPVA